MVSDRETIVKQQLYIRSKSTKSNRVISGGSANKKGCIPLGISLLACGPAWAWTRDLQIMSRKYLVFSDLYFMSFHIHTSWFPSPKIIFSFQIISLVFFYFLEMRANCVQNIYYSSSAFSFLNFCIKALLFILLLLFLFAFTFIYKSASRLTIELSSDGVIDE